MSTPSNAMYRSSTHISLHEAVLTPNPDMLKLFLQQLNGLTQENRSAILNAQDEHGYTPLAYAVWTQCSSFVSMLLQAGADPNAKTRDGDTPLHLFLHSHSVALDPPSKNYEETRQKLISLLLNHDNFQRHVVNMLIRSRWTEDLKYNRPEVQLALLQARANISLTDKHGYTFFGLLDEVIARVDGLTFPIHRQQAELYVSMASVFMDHVDEQKRQRNSIR